MRKVLTNQIARLNRIDTFSPYFFLPFILLLYFFVSLFDFHRFELFHVNESIWPVVFVAVISYYIGVYIVDKKGWTFPTFGLTFLRGHTTLFIWLLALVGGIALLTMMSEGQLDLASASFKSTVDPKLSFLSQLLWFAGVLVIAMQITKSENLTKAQLVMYGSFYITIMVVFLIAGQRTPIVIMLFTGLVIVHYVIKRIKLIWFLTTLLLIGVFFSLFGFYMVLTEDTTNKLNDRTQPDVELTEEQAEQLLTVQEQVNAVPKWVRSLNGESVTSHIVLSKIIEYTKEHGYLNGQIYLGVFETILPGEQISPRMRVTEIVNSLSVEDGKYITRPTRITTPTYIGQLFLDGGYVLVVIGFLFFGIVISLLYNQVKRNGFKSYQSISYAFVLAVFTVSMHTGLLDLIFLLMIGFVIFTAMINNVKER
ncbi:oligosaccharide repeat unit polymerase [Sporosarcina sp. CAU 1771]